MISLKALFAVPAVAVQPQGAAPPPPPRPQNPHVAHR